LDEAKHLISFDHRNVIEYRDVFVHRARAPARQDFVCIVMECCDGGTLKDVVLAGALDFSGLVDALRQISLALAYLHDQGVLHCDVKLENVLVQSDAHAPRYTLKIGDFGLATQLHDSATAALSPVKRASGGAARGIPGRRRFAGKGGGGAGRVQGVRGDASRKESVGALSGKKKRRRRRRRGGKGAPAKTAAAGGGGLEASAAGGGAAAATRTPPKKRKRKRRRRRRRGRGASSASAADPSTRRSNPPAEAHAAASAALGSPGARASSAAAALLDTPWKKRRAAPGERGGRKKSAAYSRPHLGYARGVLGGTSAYKSPESFDSAPATLRTLPNGTVGVSAAVDVWGVGCLLWEAATGEELPDDSEEEEEEEDSSGDSDDDSSASSQRSRSSRSSHSSRSRSRSRSSGSSVVGAPEWGSPHRTKQRRGLSRPPLEIVARADSGAGGWIEVLSSGGASPNAAERSAGAQREGCGDAVATPEAAAREAGAAEAASASARAPSAADARAMVDRVTSVKLLGKYALNAKPGAWNKIVDTLRRRFEIGIDALLEVEARRWGALRAPAKRRRRRFGRSRSSGGGGGGRENPFAPLIDEVDADDAARHMDRCRASRPVLTRLLTEMLERTPARRPRMRDVTDTPALSADEFFFEPHHVVQPRDER
jgi:serine/threonine protein kinase